MQLFDLFIWLLLFSINLIWCVGFPRFFCKLVASFYLIFEIYFKKLYISCYFSLSWYHLNWLPVDCSIAIWEMFYQFENLRKYLSKYIIKTNWAVQSPPKWVWRYLDEKIVFCMNTEQWRNEFKQSIWDIWYLDAFQGTWRCSIWHHRISTSSCKGNRKPHKNAFQGIWKLGSELIYNLVLQVYILVLLLKVVEKTYET